MSMSEIAAHVVVEEEDVDNLVREIDTEWIRKEVFKLYGIDYGLDTKLALRKVQILEGQDPMLLNYIACLEEAHNRFLTLIEQGNEYPKMEQNPLHSQDLNYGVPPIFNALLDQLLDETMALYIAQQEQNAQTKPIQNQEDSTGSTSKAEIVKSSLNINRQRSSGNEESKSPTQIIRHAQSQPNALSRSTGANLLKRPSFDANATQAQKFSGDASGQNMKKSFLAKSLSINLHLCPPMTNKDESEQKLFGQVINQNTFIGLSEEDEANLSMERESVFSRQTKVTSVTTTQPRQRMASPAKVIEQDEENSSDK